MTSLFTKIILKEILTVWILKLMKGHGYSMKAKAFEKLAENVIQNLQKRNMEGYYFKDSASCVKAIMDMIPKDSIVSWGGSMTLEETGMMAALKASDLTLIDRANAKTDKEFREIFAKTVMSDYFFMSTNAITKDGILVNIDGNANRVACLAHGPSHVMILVGRNKFTASVESAIERTRNTASPANAIRLNRNLPCAMTGSCHDCLSPECFCNQIVITRRSRHTGRIKVFLINEDLGY